MVTDIPEIDVMAELEEECSNALEAASAFRDSLLNNRDVAEMRNEMKKFEHQGDEIVHRIFDEVNSTFITPVDREDIVAIAGNLDSILDMLYAAALRIDLYKVQEPTKPMVELADIVCSCLGELQKGLRLIRGSSKTGDLEARAVEVNRLENLADELMNRAVAGLFESNDPVRIIKLKEVYEKLEEATDYCEDVADVLMDLAAKNQ